ncbi:hypothetical protein GCM10010530_44190 [Kribbella aluminosa]
MYLQPVGAKPSGRRGAESTGAAGDECGSSHRFPSDQVIGWIAADGVVQRTLPTRQCRILARPERRTSTQPTALVGQRSKIAVRFSRVRSRTPRAVAQIVEALGHSPGAPIQKGFA